MTHPHDSTAKPVTVTDVLRRVIHWAGSKCQAGSDENVPCKLCGASGPNGEACKAVEHMFPRQLLADLNDALLASPDGIGAGTVKVRDLADARRKHRDAVTAYNKRLLLVRSERERGNHSMGLDDEYVAMSEAQSNFIKTAQDVADALLFSPAPGNGEAAEAVEPCPVCGCEERGQGGYLSCECPSPIDTLSSRVEAAEARVKVLTEALQNMVGAFDTPIVRRKLPPTDLMREAVSEARALLAPDQGGTK